MDTYDSMWSCLLEADDPLPDAGTSGGEQWEGAGLTCIASAHADSKTSSAPAMGRGAQPTGATTAPATAAAAVAFQRYSQRSQAGQLCDG